MPTQPAGCCLIELVQIVVIDVRLVRRLVKARRSLIILM
jgi:hypothetical protein